MPPGIPRPCIHPGCSKLTLQGRCDAHRTAHRQQQDQRRGTTAERGYGARWQRVSKQFRLDHPLCALCIRAGTVRASEVVDHIIPHKGDQRLMWDQRNLQALCKPCHDSHKQREDRGGVKNFQDTPA